MLTQNCLYPDKRAFGLFYSFYMNKWMGIGLGLILCVQAFAQTPERGRFQSGRLSVLTFNSWLLDVPIYPFGFRSDISKDYDLRMNALPSALAATQADVIVLQEVWSQNAKRKIAERMRKEGYGYAAYTRASNWFFVFQVEMGDGLLVLSKFPISSHVLTFKFSKATQSAERFTSKGAMKLEIKHPELGWIDFYASHAGAVGFENGNYIEEEMKLHSEQILELAEWMRNTRSHEVSVLGADLNMHYQHWDGHRFLDQFSSDYLKLTHRACGSGSVLQDSFMSVHPETVFHHPAFTFSQLNPYVGDGYFDSLPSEVEDYVFICKNQNLTPVESRVVLNEGRVQFQDKTMPLSDHFGVLSVFQSKQRIE